MGHMPINQSCCINVWKKERLSTSIYSSGYQFLEDFGCALFRITNTCHGACIGLTPACLVVAQ